MVSSILLNYWAIFFSHCVSISDILKQVHDVNSDEFIKLEILSKIVNSPEVKFTVV